MTNPKLVIKVNDKMVEFDLTDDQSKQSYRVLSDDEAAEHFMLLKPDGSNSDAHLQAELNHMVEEVTEKLRESFKGSLQHTVLSMLGFTNRWSSTGWEVDSTNNKVGVIGQLITDEMKKFIAAEVVNPAKIFSPKEIDVVISAAKKKFKEAYTYSISQHVRHEMEVQIKDMISKMVAELLAHQEIEIKKTVASLVSKPKLKSR